MVFSGILLSTNKNNITSGDVFDESTYVRNSQTFKSSGTFIMSMNDDAWDGSPPYKDGITDNNITYTITTSSSGGITTVQVNYQYDPGFDPTLNTTVNGLFMHGKSYYMNMTSNNFNIIQFDSIPLNKDYQQFQPGSNGLFGLTVSATDQPYIQKNTTLSLFIYSGKNGPKEAYEWVGRLDTINATLSLSQAFTQCYLFNTNLNKWNINNNISIQIRTESYEAMEIMSGLTDYYVPDYWFYPNIPELANYQSYMYNVLGVSTDGGLTHYNSFSHIFEDCTQWNNGSDPGVGNLFTWVFCTGSLNLKSAFKNAINCNIRMSEPFILSGDMESTYENCTLWNNGFSPGESWSLKDHKWSFGAVEVLNNCFKDCTSFNGDFTGILAPKLRHASFMFYNCSSLDTDLTDFIKSLRVDRNSYIAFEGIISYTGLSVENYSKFIIALKYLYDINPNAFFPFTYTINQYYNSSAVDALNALKAANKVFNNDLGLQP